MKKLLVLIIVILGSSCALQAQTKAGIADTNVHATYYTCGHHPNVKSDIAGKCPICGMALSLSSKEQIKVAVTRNYTCPVHLDVTSHNAGKCPKCGKKLHLSAKEQMKAEIAKVFTCPMHPSVALDKEGNCPKCGMALVEKKSER